jgi:hypothetical protein
VLIAERHQVALRRLDLELFGTETRDWIGQVRSLINERVEGFPVAAGGVEGDAHGRRRFSRHAPTLNPHDVNAPLLAAVAHELQRLLALSTRVREDRAAVSRERSAVGVERAAQHQA